MPNRPLTIAIVLEIFFPTVNGVITSSLNLAENLISRGHRVIIFAPRWREYHEPVVNGIPVYYIQSAESFVYPGMRNVLPWNRRVTAILQREKVDLVHITGPYMLTWALLRAAGRLRIPVVHTFHTMLHEKSYIQYVTKTSILVPLIRVLSKPYFGLFIKRSTVMTGPSRMVCNYLKRHYPLADVRHISNGVDVERFEHFATLEQLKSRVPQWNEKSFLFVGRIGPEKSVDQLVQAMAHVRSADPSVRLFIVGDGPGRNRYEQLARQLRLTKNVFFLGRIAHHELISSGLIHHARAFVTASTTENQPMTVIEAICCHVPIVVPNVRGIIELLSENGLTFPAGDRAGLAEAMLRLAHDDNEHRRCRERSITLAHRYDGRVVADQFLNVYREALAR